MDLQGDLAAADAEHRPPRADQIARVEVREQVEVALAEEVAAREQLEPPSLILQVCKR